MPYTSTTPQTREINYWEIINLRASLADEYAVITYVQGYRDTDGALVWKEQCTHTLRGSAFLAALQQVVPTGTLYDALKGVLYGVLIDAGQMPEDAEDIPHGSEE